MHAACVLVFSSASLFLLAWWRAGVKRASLQLWTAPLFSHMERGVFCQLCQAGLRDAVLHAFQRFQRAGAVGGDEYRQDACFRHIHSKLDGTAGAAAETAAFMKPRAACRQSTNALFRERELVKISVT